MDYAQHVGKPLMTNSEYAEAKKNGPLSPLTELRPMAQQERPTRKSAKTSAPAANEPVLPGKTLYLRLPSNSAIEMIKPVLSGAHGELPVVLYIESTGAKLRAPQELFVRPTQRLIDKLNDMLGTKNVVLK